MNIGEKMPDTFGLDQNGNEVTLKSLNGKKAIIYAYPKDNTSGCTAEACSLKEHYGELQAAGYEVIGISKDSAASHQKFINKYELPFKLVADTDTTMLQKLGAWGEKVACGRRTMGTLRTTWIINENGEVEKIFTPKEIKTKIHAEQIMEYIEQKK